uniref:Uncharacterized protein n=1 Tax=Arundo donax TaxID=35708 RepID=A0A0A9CS08_ARUDO
MFSRREWQGHVNKEKRRCQVVAMADGLECLYNSKEIGRSIKRKTPNADGISNPD